MFLDNVTTIMMMTPVVIRICEVLSVKPAPVLIVMLICCNLAGVATPIGDPPNIMIMSSPLISKEVTFVNFTIHMTFGIVFALAIAYVQLRFLHLRNDFKVEEEVNPNGIEEEIQMWRSAARHLSMEEGLIRDTVERKIDQLDHKLHRTKTLIELPTVAEATNVLHDLQKKVRARPPHLVYDAYFLTFMLNILFHTVSN